MCAPSPIEKFDHSLFRYLEALRRLQHSPRSGFCAPAFSIIVDVHLVFSRLVGKPSHTPPSSPASERLAEVCLRYTRTSSSCPRLGSLRPSTRLCTGAPPATSAALTTPANFNPSVSLHSICIRPASAAPAASF